MRTAVPFSLERVHEGRHADELGSPETGMRLGIITSACRESLQLRCRVG